VGILLKCLMHYFNVVIRHMRSTRTPAFTQAQFPQTVTLFLCGASF
jgi:hypothetical protein